ncbi:MAG: hypothetical protein HKN82_05415 [Akkermansiaceae bacterium]|nr:hypothetical protein [Akkermansiaceae bacterium]NNM30844.1 hypothetical protein [Akkermansiaceae bacterium]
MLLILGLAASAAGLHGQVQVSLRLERDQFVAHEAVLASLTITNRSGRDIYLHSDKGQSWLDFVIKNQRGTPLTSLQRGAGFKAVNVPAGRSVSQTVNLSSLYPLSSYGRYAGYAVVRIPGDGQNVFSSNRLSFNVTKARTLYSQRIGVGGVSNPREYRLLTFSRKGKTHLYVQVEDLKRGRILQTYSVGEVLTFRQPHATVDGANNLHFLYLVSPTVFTHAVVNPEGKFLGSEQFKRGATGEPRLVTFANGEVQVGGGVPYDPAAARARRGTVRKLSERPKFAYR